MMSVNQLNPPTHKMLKKMDPRHVERMEWLKYLGKKRPVDK